MEARLAGSNVICPTIGSVVVVVVVGGNVVVVVGGNVVVVVGGNVVVETVFSWPGLGRLLVNAVASSDYPLAQGAFLLITVVLAVTLLAHHLLNVTPVIVHFFYLPVIIAAYYFGRNLACLTAVLSVRISP